MWSTRLHSFFRSSRVFGWLCSTRVENRTELNSPVLISKKFKVENGNGARQPLDFMHSQGFVGGSRTSFAIRFVGGKVVSPAVTTAVAFFFFFPLPNVLSGTIQLPHQHTFCAEWVDTHHHRFFAGLVTTSSMYVQVSKMSRVRRLPAVV